MGINKVVHGGNTLIDISEDTVTPESLLAGYIAHASDGSKIVGTNEGGGSTSIKIVTGTFTVLGDTYVDITFDQEMDEVPELILFHEINATYNSQYRTKYAVGGRTTPLYTYTYSSITRYITEVYCRGYSTSNSTSFYYTSSSNISGSGIDYSTTATSGSPIKNATTTGFRACGYSTTYPLYGTYRYYAVVFG